MSDKLHAVLGASSCERWIACPGSIRLTADLPRTTNEYAELGTAAHAVAERCLREGINAKAHIGKSVRKSAHDGKFILCDEEMAEAVQVYLDGVREQQRLLPGSTLMIEQRFKLDWLYPGLFGTNDSTVFQPFGTMHVNDYKHGQGVAVDAEENGQLMYYGLGALGEGNVNCVEQVVVSIFQPRAPGEPVKVWETTPEVLLAWANDVLVPAAKLANTEDAPLKAGSHCKFCPALATCPATRQKAFEKAQLAFSKVDVLPIGGKAALRLPPATSLTTEHLESIHEVAGLISDWADGVTKELRSRLERGTDAKKFKLVAGRKTRKWADEMVAMDSLKPLIDVWDTKVVSPAKAEQRIKDAGYDPADLLSNLVVEERGTAIVPMSDKRPALDSAVKAFSALPQTTTEKE